ncbi:Choline/ethanolamine kinase [Halotydeus destructor]|nr:Choline/ethanolamine kinase [Halotydeus destructor]
MELNHLTKDIEPSKLLDICKSHFGDQWDEVNETNFDITVLTAGFSSRLFLCTIKDGGPVVSPAKVLVRFYGGNFAAPDIVVRTMSEAAEVLLFDRLNRVGLAPQLLGVFDGGRIEQFIESRNFTHDEFRLDDKKEMGHSLKGINLSKLLEICKNHLGNEWGEVDEANFDAKFVTDGMTNRLGSHRTVHRV